mmetsp:Transcript_7601/g.46855  ORF Transcript_7601/g.46855 Transcript_7601/m.46855 type:complete len:360 (+) Transcript_7601:812-1891(+)
MLRGYGSIHHLRVVSFQGRDPWSRQFRSVQSGFAVYLGANFRVSEERPCASGDHRNVCSSTSFEHAPCIVGGPVEGLVGLHGADAEEVQFLAVHRQKDGQAIVVSRIAIQPNCCLSLCIGPSHGSFFCFANPSFVRCVTCRILQLFFLVHVQLSSHHGLFRHHRAFGFRLQFLLSHRVSDDPSHACASHQCGHGTSPRHAHGLVLDGMATFHARRSFDVANRGATCTKADVFVRTLMNECVYYGSDACDVCPTRPSRSGRCTTGACRCLRRTSARWIRSRLPSLLPHANIRRASRSTVLPQLLRCDCLSFRGSPPKQVGAHVCCDSADLPPRDRTHVVRRSPPRRNRRGNSLAISPAQS